MKVLNEEVLLSKFPVGSPCLVLLIIVCYNYLAVFSTSGKNDPQWMAVCANCFLVPNHTLAAGNVNNLRYLHAVE